MFLDCIKLRNIIGVFLAISIFFTSSFNLFAGEIEFTQVEPFNPSKMTEKERQDYYAAIDKQVEIYIKNHGNDNAENFRKELIYVLENSNSLKHISKINIKMERDGTWIPDVKIKNDVVAAAMGVIIDTALIASGVGSITMLVKKIGVREAKKIFTKSIKSKLTAWGAGVLATSIPVAVDFILSLVDPGTAIAEFFDSIDDFPDNGYLDLIL